MITPLIKNAIIVVVGFIACAVLALFGVRPMLSSAAGLKHELDAKNAQIASLQQQIQAYVTAKSDLARATDKEKISDAFLIKENLVDEIQQMESEAGITKTTESLSITDPFIVKNEDADQPKSQPLVKGLSGVTEVPYRITGLAEYGNVIDFLSYLDHLPNFTEVSKIQISAETTDSAGSSKPVHTGRSLINIDGVFFVNTNGNTQN